jgi:hypothetical protein
MMPMSNPIAIFFFNIAINNPSPNPTINANAGDLLMLWRIGFEIRVGDQISKQAKRARNTCG